MGMGQCRRLAAVGRRQFDRHFLYAHGACSRQDLLLRGAGRRRQRRTERVVGVCRGNGARERSVYADSDIDTDSNPSGWRRGYANGDYNFHTDSNSGGCRYGNTNGDCNSDTDSNSACCRCGNTNGDSNGDCNSDTDSNSGGCRHGYTHGDTNGDRGFGRGFSATGFADRNAYVRACGIGTGGSGTDSRGRGRKD